MRDKKKTGSPTYVPIVSATKTRPIIELELEYYPLPPLKNGKTKAAQASKKKPAKRRKS
jgi:hypothetical protein